MLTVDTGNTVITIDSYYGSGFEFEMKSDLSEFIENREEILDTWLWADDRARSLAEAERKLENGKVLFKELIQSMAGLSVRSKKSELLKLLDGVNAFVKGMDDL